MAKKRKVITINGMVKKFGVTRMTIYNKYIPELKAIPSTMKKRIFDYDEVMKLHESFSKEEKKFEIVDLMKTYELSEIEAFAVILLLIFLTMVVEAI